MSGKRKDHKGRLLRSGEYQRQNLTYEYRYKDEGGTAHSIYAKTLDELRQQETEIQRDQLDGIDYAGGEITVSELIDRYMATKRKLKTNSLRAYSTPIKYIKNDPFGQRKIKQIKPSDAKRFYLQLHDEGMKRNTISIYRCILRPAFEMAVDDDLIRKNPFKASVESIIPDDAEERKALTPQEQKEFFDFVANHSTKRYYDDLVILCECGCRVSELYGLTKRDIDFEKRCVYIERQLCRTAEKPYFVETPKTDPGRRCIPLTDAAYDAFARVARNRTTPKVEMMVDGCSGFLFLDKNGNPRTAMHLQNHLRELRKKYKQLYGKEPPKVTPHVLRHTFCTHMQQAGIDVKTLQYLMGHSDITVTLGVYSHTDYDTVESKFRDAVSNL